MKASDLSKEVLALQKEVAALKKAKDKVTPSKPAKKRISRKDEARIKEVLNDLISQLKQDYHALSPVGALSLFALGVMFGALVTKSKGGR